MVRVCVQAEVYAYWESWVAHMQCVNDINAALLAYIREAAASAAVYAQSMQAAGMYILWSCFAVLWF